MNDKEKQKQKEEAVLIALQKDMALIRRNLEIWGMKKDGSSTFVSRSNDYNNLWKDALNSLLK